MIIYFADREMNILGHATSELRQGFVITEDLKTDDVETGVASFSCRIGFTKEKQTQLEKMANAGNYLLRSNDGENEFYTIIDSEVDTKNQEIIIYAEDAGLDLLNSIADAFEADSSYDAKYYINPLIADSGFQIGTCEIPESVKRQLKWESEATATERLASIATQFGGYEISYSFATKGLNITHKYIHFHKQRGQDNGVQLRLNKEVDRIITTKTVANLATAFVCEGGIPDDAENPITLKGYKYDDGDFYVDSAGVLKSRIALEKWSRYVWKTSLNQMAGYEGHITRPYSYNTTSQKELCSHAVTELKKYCDMEVNYEVDIKRLPEGVKIGDRVNIIDDAGELYLSTRLLKLETSVIDNKYTATLGEHIIKKSGISQKVADLAAEFAKSAVSVERALTISNAAKEQAADALEQAELAAEEAIAANTASEEAQAAAEVAKASAITAEAQALAAEAAVDKVVLSVQSIQNSVENAQKAADNAEAAATTAQEQAAAAARSANLTEQNAMWAEQYSWSAMEYADEAIDAADEAITTAGEAKTAAQSASDTAAAAKLDAEQAEKDVATFGENLETVKSTMSAQYARKTELTEAKADFQSQIERNAGLLSSTISRNTVIDETANDAESLAKQAQAKANKAKELADEATEDAETAQTAANEAAAAAASAQNEADIAQAAADTAQSVVNQAVADLEAARADLSTIQGRVDATEEEIAAAEKAVADAEEAANVAIENAAIALETATNAQAAADTAKKTADTAKANADIAALNAKSAQSLANETAAAYEAQKTADEAVEQASTALGTANQAVADAGNAKSDAANAANAAAVAQQTANSANNTANSLNSKIKSAVSIAESSFSVAQQADAAAQEAYQRSLQADAAADDAYKLAEEADAAAEEAGGRAIAAYELLYLAEQKLTETTARVGVTEKEIEDAQQDVIDAQAAADLAQAEADKAQATADTAKANADKAQKAADDAQDKAENAKQAADEAKDAAEEAQDAVNALAIRVEKAETSITQTNEQIALCATKKDFADLSIEGRNLILNSRRLTGSNIEITDRCTLAEDNTYKGGQIADCKSTVDGTLGVFEIRNLYFEPETVYTLSFDAIAYEDSGRVDGNMRVSFYKAGSGGVVGFYASKIETSTGSTYEDNYRLFLDVTATDWQRYWIKFTTYKSVDKTEEKSLAFSLTTYSGITQIGFANIKLEKGNKATEWTPAPEDVTAEMMAEVEQVRGSLTEARSEIITEAEGITLQHLGSYTQKTDFDTFKESTETALYLESGVIGMRFKETEQTISNVEGDMQEKFTELQKYITFTPDGIKISTGENAMTLELDNDIISFKKNGVQFGWWDGVDFHTGNIIVDVNERAQFGSFAFVPRSDGSLMFLKVGD